MNDLRFDACYCYCYCYCWCCRDEDKSSQFWTIVTDAILLILVDTCFKPIFSYIFIMSFSSMSHSNILLLLVTCLDTLWVSIDVPKVPFKKYLSVKYAYYSMVRSLTFPSEGLCCWISSAIFCLCLAISVRSLLLLEKSYYSVNLITGWILKRVISTSTII